MREIVFRGKRIANGEWIEGYITEHTMITHDMQSYIGWVIECKKTELYEYNWYEVDPVTVGQYTGLKDKNGKRIFEGDELSWHNGSGAVNFDGGCFCVRLHGEIEYYGRNNPAIDVIFNLYPELEVIGNIHDNPELMEVR